MLTVQDRWTWCCCVIMMAKGVRARPTSSSAWVSDTSVLRNIRSTTMPKSRTFRPTVSAYSLQLFLKHKYTRRQTQAHRTHRHKHKHTQEQYEIKTCHVLVEYMTFLTQVQCSPYKTESRHTFVPCWQQSQSSQQGGLCHSAAGVLHSTADIIHCADALLVGHVHLLLKRGWKE